MDNSVTQYLVERCPPIKPPRRGGGIYPFADVAPGKGFLVAAEDVRKLRNAIRVWNARNPSKRVMLGVDDAGQWWVTQA